ncbi:rIIA protector from prophage-induced early lysis protein [Rhizobium phage RHEph16]|uniref:RIIA protector from prophage-induced early lysis protein n=1 Tax=Rhizobium phage RHEph16 TaxID=2836132 RepID=A0AAE8AW18_9CAUD|nr:RIIA lysis inhibitor [Rhizobium phage RHEph16]QXV74361.1 rIIA protector from prophage-induced early lysis protein [Rhizobium phage RHEph16]
MEVAHQTDHTSHVVIGGGAIEKFQMAQTGHFFEILSNTLYANGKLAMIREVLCNAWDSHIASGVMGTAINISLDANELVIRDYGLGIPHNLVHQIYCVYGNSTKTNDGNQTGGFGLGSKAPFAYTKHFTVTNCHAGTKVVHAISRGTNGDGTPERRVIVEVPTTEQGVEVKIPIKESKDLSILQEYIETIAKYGEMNVQLNGKKLERFTLSSSKDGFYVAQGETFGINSNSKIYIRYGNVIYPVESSTEYHKELAEVLRFLENLPEANAWNSKQWKICFQAPPNSITVTPSRETIQVTSVTVETLKNLFSKVSSIKTMHQFEVLRNEMVREATEHYAKKHPEMLKKFLDGGAPFIKGTDVDAYGRQKPILSMEDARQRMVRDKFKMGASDYVLRLRLLADTGISNRGTLQQLTRCIAAYTGGNAWYDVSDKYSPATFALKYRNKLLNALDKQEGMDSKNLYFIASGTRNRGCDFIEPKDWKPTTSDRTLTFFKNKIFITYSKIAVSENIYDLVQKHGDFGIYYGVPAYVVPRRKGAYKEALDYFTKKGWEVIDVDDYVQKHVPKEVKEVDPTPKTPKVIGIPSLNMLRDPRNGNFTPRGHLAFDATNHRVEKPKAVFTAKNLGGRDYTHEFFEAKMDRVGMSILSLIGSDTAIAVNSRQKDKYIAEGSKDGYEYLAEKAWEEFETNTVLINYFGKYKLNLGTSEASTLHGLWKASKYMPSIRKLMKYPRQLTDTEYHWVRLWEHLITGVSSYRSDRFRDYWPKGMIPSLDKILKLIKESKEQACPERDEMHKRIQSKMFKYINMYEIVELVSDPKITQQEKDDAEGVLLLALEG